MALRGWIRIQVADEGQVTIRGGENQGCEFRPVGMEVRSGSICRHANTDDLDVGSGQADMKEIRLTDSVSHTRWRQVADPDRIPARNQDLVVLIHSLGHSNMEQPQVFESLQKGGPALSVDIFIKS